MRHPSMRITVLELLLAGAVLALVVLLVVPLPVWLLDVLLATQLSVAMLLLLVALTVADTRSIRVFPAVLLLTTLLRLALNVSSTRLILRDGHAGQVIDAFASWVVAGSLIVGVVIFLIITAIQFVVITRGSERIAEVAARFALDAMPGRQAAIDADVRAGVLSADAAQDARARLQDESRLFGAMDGAMKFVRGDVVAGLIILGVDLVGGVAVGVLERRMGVMDALWRFGMLTIGDGLVSQLPALLIATSAGVVVTRAASAVSAPQGGGLAAALADAFGEHPRAWASVAGLCVLMAGLPGMPWVPFLGLGVVCVALAVTQSRRVSPVHVGEDAGEDTVVTPPPALMWSWPLSHERDLATFRPEVDAAMASWRDRSGVAWPEPVWRFSSGQQVLLTLDGVEVASLSVEEVSASALIDLLETFSDQMLSMQCVSDMLDTWMAREPLLVRAAVPGHVSLFHMMRLLRCLLRDGLVLKPFRPLLEALLACPQDKDRDVVWSQEDAMRKVLSVQLQERVVAAEHFISTGDGVTRTLADAWGRGQDVWDEGMLRLPQDIVREIEDAFADVLPRDGRLGEGVVVAVGDEARRPLAMLLTASWPMLRVVGWGEVNRVARVPDTVVTLSNTEAWLS